MRRTFLDLIGTLTFAAGLGSPVRRRVRATTFLIGHFGTWIRSLILSGG
jgi:hypothetical protein